MSTDYIFETPKNLEDFKKENPDIIVKRCNEWDNESKATNPVAFDGMNYCHLYLNKKGEITSACRFGGNDVDYIIGCVGEYACDQDGELWDKYENKNTSWEEFYKTLDYNFGSDLEKMTEDDKEAREFMIEQRKEHLKEYGLV